MTEHGPNLSRRTGHTAHICVELSSEREGVVVLSDALTHPIISFAHPAGCPPPTNHGPHRAAAERKALLDKLATDRQRVIGFICSGSSYRLVPA